MNNFSDKQSTINYALEEGRFLHFLAPILFDYAVMLDNKELAKKILKWFLDFKSNNEDFWREDTLRDIANRQKALDNWV